MIGQLWNETRFFYLQNIGAFSLLSKRDSKILRYSLKGEKRPGSEGETGVAYTSSSLFFQSTQTIKKYD